MKHEGKVSVSEAEMVLLEGLDPITFVPPEPYSWGEKPHGEGSPQPTALTQGML